MKQTKQNPNISNSVVIKFVKRIFLTSFKNQILTLEQLMVTNWYENQIQKGFFLYLVFVPVCDHKLRCTWYFYLNQHLEFYQQVLRRSWAFINKHHEWASFTGITEGFFKNFAKIITFLCILPSNFIMNVFSWKNILQQRNWDCWWFCWTVV